MDSYAWLGSLELKEEILADLADDLARDRYVQGSYIAGANDGEQAFYGCHVGCLMMAHSRYENRRIRVPEPLYALARAREEAASTWHNEVPDKLGMPYVVAQFWDTFFEKLPPELAPRFAVESLVCVPVGADLRTVLASLIAWLLTDPTAGFLAGEQGATPGEVKIREYVDVVGDMWRQCAADRARPAARGLEWSELDSVQDSIRMAAHGVPAVMTSRFYYASIALLSATSGAGVHHVALALISEYVDAIADSAIPMPPMVDEFEDSERPALWAIAEKFFDLCSKAPQGVPA